MAEAPGDYGVEGEGIDQQQPADQAGWGTRGTKPETRPQYPVPEQENRLDDEGKTRPKGGRVDGAKEPEVVDRSHPGPESCEDTRHEPVAAGSRPEGEVGGQQAEAGERILGGPDAGVVLAEDLEELLRRKGKGHGQAPVGPWSRMMAYSIWSMISPSLMALCRILPSRR